MGMGIATQVSREWECGDGMGGNENSPFFHSRLFN